jgi:hypothetical protein
VTDVLLYQISNFKKIVSGPLAIIPQMLKRFPIGILGVMHLAAMVIAVAAIIAVDFDPLEFCFKKLDETFDKLLKVFFTS